MKIKIFSSIRTKLFVSLCIIVLAIISSLILMNNFVLGKFYLFNKKNNLKTAYVIINDYYNNNYSQDEINNELEKIAVKNDFDILIKNNINENIYISSKDFFNGMIQMSIISSNVIENNRKIIEKNNKFIISELYDNATNIKWSFIIYLAMLMVAMYFASAGTGNGFMYAVF